MACTVFRSPSFLSSISRSSRLISRLEITSKFTAISTTSEVFHQTHRNSSFLSSPKVRELQEYPEVEIVRNPPEWKYVERLIPAATVPLPPTKGENFASGWSPQRKYDPKKDAYFIRRTKNHMIPVYILKTYRGTRQITSVRNIQGDIWALEKVLRKVIQDSQGGRLVASRVNEMVGQITFHGDYVDLLMEYLQKEGF